MLLLFAVVSNAIYFNFRLYNLPLAMPAECRQCGRCFDFGNQRMDENSLRQHMQVNEFTKTLIDDVLRNQCNENDQ